MCRDGPQLVHKQHGRPSLKCAERRRMSWVSVFICIRDIILPWEAQKPWQAVQPQRRHHFGGGTGNCHIWTVAAQLCNFYYKLEAEFENGFPPEKKASAVSGSWSLLILLHLSLHGSNCLKRSPCFSLKYTHLWWCFLPPLPHLLIFVIRDTPALKERTRNTCNH